MFSKVLIANRGEIAVRIIQTCKRMGIKTVAVYAEADISSLYVRDADEAVFIGAAPAKESFLNTAKLIKVALKNNCQAVHPGYGFLSESAAFAESVTEAGLTFIGPTPEAIARLGDKTASKALALAIGVPVVPGVHEPLTDLNIAAEAALKIGFPLLLKPAAGGGGRGMRIVRHEDELESALSTCMEETKKSFGDNRIFIEKFISKPRHIEFQIFADNYGEVIHLGERECSVQRRYQKVIEETPSVAVDDELRGKMTKAACDLARAAGYTNAGTAEFILDEHRNYYFLEMNTRLQVEHPVTEMVTNLDLVELQLRIAAGEPLKIKQEDINFKGWAIEARICAEDPYRGFLPTTGMVTRYANPKGKNIRVDSGVAAGSIVTIYYDSLIAKISAWGRDRFEAVNTLNRALNGYHIEGVTTNVDFANAVINHPEFISGELSTHFIDDHFLDGESKVPPTSEHIHLMVIAASLIFHSRRMLMKEALKPMSPLIGGKTETIESAAYAARIDGRTLSVELKGSEASRNWTFLVGGKTYLVTTPELEYYRRRLKLDINGASHMFRLQYSANHIQAFFSGNVETVEIYTPREWNLMKYMKRGSRVIQDTALKCPMPGLITAVCVDEGAQVRKGQELMRMESMKMESGVASPVDGQIDEICVKPGQAVETDEVLLKFKL